MANEKPSYQWLTPVGNLYDFKDKKKSVQHYVGYMLDRCESMFEYDNLPDSIPKRNLELMLMVNGFVCITKVNDKLYAFWGSLGGEPNEYYEPTICIVANPYLKFNKDLRINKDCIIIRNDSMYLGLLPMFNRYATQLVENDISLNLVDVLSRVQALLSAKDDKTQKALKNYIDSVIKGDISFVGESALMDSLKVSPYNEASNRTITQLIEYEQYVKASWFNEIGLNANYNMKRESLNTEESLLNQDALLPLVDDMLEQRRIGLELVNKMFGTNIEVRLASSWRNNELEQREEDNTKANDDLPEGDKEGEGENVGQSTEETIS